MWCIIYFNICRFVWQHSRLKAISLNVLMLYDNMKQLAKLSESIFALLTWTYHSRESVIKKHKNTSNFAEYFKIRSKMCIFK